MLEVKTYKDLYQLITVEFGSELWPWTSIRNYFKDSRVDELSVIEDINHHERIKKSFGVRLCPFDNCDWIGGKQFSHHIETIHDKSPEDYIILRDNLKEFPKCPVCGEDCTYDHKYFVHKTCSPTCSYELRFRIECTGPFNKRPDGTSVSSDAVDNGSCAFLSENLDLDNWGRSIMHLDGIETKIKEGTFFIPTSYSSVKCSLFTKDSKTYRLRSSYEFIYALYLSVKGYKWSYETAIVYDSIKYDDHGGYWFNDFVVGKTIFEVKPDADDVPESQISSAKSMGYKFRIIDYDAIDRYSEFLKTKILSYGSIIDELWKASSGNPFVFNFDTFII